MEIRPASVSDLQAIQRIDALSFPELSYPYFVLRQYLDTFGDFFQVALKDDVPVAYIAGGLASSGKMCWIHSLAVLPEHRRKGLAGSLLASFLQTSKNHHVNSVLLTVHPEEPAVFLYQKHGFVVEKQLPDYYGDGKPRLIMKKRL
jgi:ribosomal-protein-alanine N-acetyltransferase